MVPHCTHVSATSSWKQITKEKETTDVWPYLQVPAALAAYVARVLFQVTGLAPDALALMPSNFTLFCPGGFSRKEANIPYLARKSLCSFKNKSASAEPVEEVPLAAAEEVDVALVEVLVSAEEAAVAVAASVKVVALVDVIGVFTETVYEGVEPETEDEWWCLPRVELPR